MKSFKEISSVVFPKYGKYAFFYHVQLLKKELVKHGQSAANCLTLPLLLLHYLLQMLLHIIVANVTSVNLWDKFNKIHA